MPVVVALRLEAVFEFVHDRLADLTGLFALLVTASGREASVPVLTVVEIGQQFQNEGSVDRTVTFVFIQLAALFPGLPVIVQGLLQPAAVTVEAPAAFLDGTQEAEGLFIPEFLQIEGADEHIVRLLQRIITQQCLILVGGEGQCLCQLLAICQRHPLRRHHLCQQPTRPVVGIQLVQLLRQCICLVRRDGLAIEHIAHLGHVFFGFSLPVDSHAQPPLSLPRKRGRTAPGVSAMPLT